jgi:hypothetical protein
MLSFCTRDWLAAMGKLSHDTGHFKKPKIERRRPKTPETQEEHKKEKKRNRKKARKGKTQTIKG